jgi:hypothetical protein
MTKRQVMTMTWTAAVLTVMQNEEQMMHEKVDLCLLFGAQASLIP